jgi:FHA domain
MGESARWVRNLGTRICAPRPHSVRLEGEPLKIGRAGHTNGPLSLHDPECSRDHALLDYEPKSDSWTIRDLASRNGTFVDGVKVEAAILLDETVVRVGKTLLLAIDERRPRQPRDTRHCDDVLPAALAALPDQSGAWGISIDAAEALLLHRWPADPLNAELTRVVREAVGRAWGKTELTIDHLPADLAAPLLLRGPRGSRTSPGRLSARRDADPK